MSTSTGYEAAHIAQHGTPEQRALYAQLHDVKARLFRAPEHEHPELCAQVGRLTQEIRNALRERGTQ